MNQQIKYIAKISTQYKTYAEETDQLFEALNNLSDDEIGAIYKEHGDVERSFHPVNLLRAEVARELLSGSGINNAKVEEINERIRRNNKFYDFILNICRLIFENSLISEQTGDFNFTDFVRNERKMSSLFETFFRNFYTIEQTNYKVKRENIYWQFSAQNQQHLDFLPLMQTDITLENDKSKILIDANFY